MKVEAKIEKKRKKIFERKGESEINELLNELDKAVQKEIESKK